MNDTKITEINSGLTTAFIDKTYNSNLAYRPEFVSNDRKSGKKVLASIENELQKCDEFAISVAFITDSGIEALMMTLQELERRGIPGRILTTDYLLFSDPKAIKRLHNISNLEIRMYHVAGSDDGFHTKGYIFKQDEIYRIIVGSSNMTKTALTVNKEWNTKIVSTEQGEMAEEILYEFESLWSHEQTLSYNDFIESYTTEFENKKQQDRLIKKIAAEQKKLAASANVPSIEAYRLKPNLMQATFIENLKTIVDAGKERALLISATGTGKTYASAFAMRELGYKRVLFIAHRDHLIKQTVKSYGTVFADTLSMGVYGGSKKESDADYVFAMIETLHKDENLHSFAPDTFECIIIDEAHHSSANTYQKVMNYFKPSLWLGMTATPDKRDDGDSDKNIYEIFNHEIACEIRLQDAMENDLLCPFHYFGISDIDLIDDEVSKAKKKEDIDFNILTSDERIKHIIEQEHYYNHSGERLKGLIFVSRVEEADRLAEKMNQQINPENGKKFRTISLNGSAKPVERQRAFDRLAQDEDDENALDYIVSVDILNEGTDIVEVNQVIMLRPTESPIVFIQQLGRGLRKCDGKEYVVILDFIGNYKNNFMIPVALSGDRTYNKDNVRRYVTEGNRLIPGVSTIHFDEVARKKIYAAIDNANFSDIKLIKENYTNLKNKLGRIPKLIDFDAYGEMDVLRIFDNKSLGSYYKFLVKYEKEYKVRLSETEEKVVQFISTKLANGKRIDELLLLKRCLTYQHELIGMYVDEMEHKYSRIVTTERLQNVINILTNEFPSGSGKATFKDCVLLSLETVVDHSYNRLKTYAEGLLGKGKEYGISGTFAKMLENQEFYQIVEELLDFGISRYERDYSKRYQDTDFVLYQKYTYEDACRLLNWEHNEVPLNIGGYKYDKLTKTFPVFINYDKSEDVVDTQQYEDRFISQHSLISISKSGRSMASEDVMNFMHAKERGIDVQLFVRKNKDDKISKEFYYLGRMTATGVAKEFTLKNTEKTAIEMEWTLDVPVREDIYEYIVSE